MGTPEDDLQLVGTEQLLLDALCGEQIQSYQLSDKLRTALLLRLIKAFARNFHDYKMFESIGEDMRQEFWHSPGYGRLPKVIEVDIKHPFKQDLDRVKFFKLQERFPVEKQQGTARKEVTRSKLLLLDRDGVFYWWYTTYSRRISTHQCTDWSIESSYIEAAGGVSLKNAIASDRYMVYRLLKHLRDEADKESRKRDQTSSGIKSAITTLDAIKKKVAF